MSTRAATYEAEVLSRTPLADHLVRLVLGGPGLAGFTSTGVPDEWVGLVVPGQFQSRYYTVRAWDGVAADPRRRRPRRRAGHRVGGRRLRRATP